MGGATGLPGFDSSVGTSTPSSCIVANEIPEDDVTAGSCRSVATALFGTGPYPSETLHRVVPIPPVEGGLGDQRVQAGAEGQRRRHDDHGDDGGQDGASGRGPPSARSVRRRRRTCPRRPRAAARTGRRGRTVDERRTPAAGAPLDAVRRPEEREHQAPSPRTPTRTANPTPSTVQSAFTPGRGRRRGRVRSGRAGTGPAPRRRRGRNRPRWSRRCRAARRAPSSPGRPRRRA